ncbi:MAG: Ig-like domain-containing protein, partial [Armatimonadota bacterium]
TPINIDVLDNDDDPEGDPLTVVSVEEPDNGTATIISAGRVRYDPDDGFTGTDMFDYTINDGEGGEDTATVVVTVVPLLNSVAAGCTPM